MPRTCILVLVALGTISAAPDHLDAATDAPENAYKPGASFKDCEECPEMVVVPAGEFTMGTPPDEQGHNDDEGPQHKVRIPVPFAVGKFEVTFDEWDACVAGGGCNGYSPDDVGWGRGRHPVINVSWEDAKAYAAWLSKKTDKPYRLPSESEWEYVARAGTTTPYWWGATIARSQASYDTKVVAPECTALVDEPLFDPERGDVTGLKRSECHSKKDQDSDLQLVPVDSFEPNPWGLYNVHGNAAEWVEDCWRDAGVARQEIWEREGKNAHEDYRSAQFLEDKKRFENYLGTPADGSPLISGVGTGADKGRCYSRQRRGGSYISAPSRVRSGARDHASAHVRMGLGGMVLNGTGLRVARALGL